MFTCALQCPNHTELTFAYEQDNQAWAGDMRKLLTEINDKCVPNSLTAIQTDLFRQQY